MTKAKTTRHALFMSVLSMMLCMAMLVSSTFAWFTDSVTSGNNRIVAGNLDVELYYKNASTGDWKDASAASTENPNFFVDKDGNDILWEPGVMAITQFKVANVGSLALRYSLETIKADFNALDGHDLSEVIRLAVIKNAEYTTREQILALNPQFDDFTGFTATGELYPEKNEDEKASEEIFTVVAYWEANVKNDDLYNVNNNQEVDKKLVDKDGKEINCLYIDIDIQLNATQYNFEKDSFDENYDEACQILGAHDVGEWTEIKAATCEKAGEKTGTCKRCGENITEAIPALEHEWGSSYAVDLTNFSKHVKICERCNKKLEGSEEEHTFTDNVCTKCNYMNNSSDISSYADVANVDFDFGDYTATGSFTITFGEQVLTYEFEGQTPLAANNSHPEYGSFYSFKIELNGTERTLYFNVVPTWSNSNGWYVDLA